MRLGQLARKLTLRPDQIIEFLAKKNIQIEEGSNTRLEDNHVALIVEKFAPHGFYMSPQELRSEETIEEVTTPEVILSSPAEKIEVNILQVETSVFETMSQEKTEVIKAPKIELSGLKVLGKIDLPESKKKEELTTEPLSKGEGATNRKLQERKPRQNRNVKTNSRPAKNPVALQREREEMEAQRKREEARAMEKEKRAQHYFSKVKVIAPVKAPKREQVVKEVSEPLRQPKTWLGKFFRWFTT